MKYLFFVFLFIQSFRILAVDPMNVLFIGNSYTHYNAMPKIFEQIATSKGVKINVDMSAKSNHTLRMHCNRSEMFEKIKSRKWDYVIVQGFSRELLHEAAYLDTSFVPYFNRIKDSIYANNSCTNILLYMTWGYKNGIEANPNYDTYQKMNDNVAMGYEYISNLYSLPVVPVGQVWETVKTNHPEINLYQDDNQHPSIFGSYLIASTFYSAILKASPEGGFVPEGVDSKNAGIIQRTAYTFVNMNINRYDLRLNTLDIKGEKLSSNKYQVTCKSFYPKAKSIEWDFGDGKKSTNENEEHIYTKHGSYTITLTVIDECGKRVILRKVTFEGQDKPATTKPKTTPPTKKTTSSKSKTKSKSNSSDSTSRKNN